MIKFLFKNKYLYDLNKIGKFTKFIFFQNPCSFNPTTFYVESINPNHKFMVYAKRKSFRNYGFIRIAKIIR
jgi:hypothetical protein